MLTFTNIMGKYLLLIYCICGSLISVYSQNEDYEQWNKMHNWDGVTPWNNYIIYSPYYLGPNALSVPESEKGLIRDRFELKARYDYHWSNGDQTNNLFLSTYIPLLKDKIAVNIYGVLLEHYKLDSSTIYERRTRNMSGKGYAVGDVYFSSIFQIVRNRKFPDLALRVSFRFPSGNKLADARTTDAPGYFMDLSIGKDIEFKEKLINKIRLYGMGGFYVWQMNMTNNMQNDAIMFGLGIDLSIKQFIIANGVEGYWGYMGNRELIIVKKDEPVPFHDRPIVYRGSFTSKWKHIDMKLGYQLGLHDFRYQTLSLSFIYHLKTKGLFFNHNQ